MFLVNIFRKLNKNQIGEQQGINENLNPEFQKQDSINSQVTDFGGDNFALPQIKSKNQTLKSQISNGSFNDYQQPVISMNSEEKAHLQTIVANSVLQAQMLQFKPLSKQKNRNQKEFIKQQQKIRRKNNLCPKPPIQKFNNDKQISKLFKQQHNYLMKVKRNTQNTMIRIQSQQKKKRLPFQKFSRKRRKKSTPRSEYKRRKKAKRLPRLQKFLNNNKKIRASLNVRSRRQSRSRKKSRNSSRRQLRSGQPRRRTNSGSFATKSQQQEEEKQIIIEVDPLLEVPFSNDFPYLFQKTNETNDQPWIRYQFSNNKQVVPQHSSIKYEAQKIEELHKKNKKALNEMILYKQMLLNVQHEKLQLEKQTQSQGVFRK